jgi:hypothetical protein
VPITCLEALKARKSELVLIRRALAAPLARQKSLPSVNRAFVEVGFCRWTGCSHLDSDLQEARFSCRAYMAAHALTSCRDPTQLLREWDPDRGSVNCYQLLLPELTEEPRDGFPGTPDEIGQLFMRQGHREAHLRLADRLSSSPLQQHTGQPSSRGLREGQSADVAEGCPIGL